jgi:Cu-Zn family superoxide dismutase
VRILLASLGIVSALSAIVGIAAAQNSQQHDSVAMLSNQAGERVGTVVFIQQGDHVLVQASANGLPAGFHGFHIHSVGECNGDFTTAGGHLSPAGANHPDHNGDMPVLLVDAGGTAQMSLSTDRFSVQDLLEGGGRAVIVHAAPDNYGNIPSRYTAELDATTLATGDAGARIACGVIE